MDEIFPACKRLISAQRWCAGGSADPFTLGSLDEELMSALRVPVAWCDVRDRLLSREEKRLVRLISLR